MLHFIIKNYIVCLATMSIFVLSSITIKVCSQNKFVHPVVASTNGSSSLPNLTDIEYYIDNDPGYGKATSIGITSGTSVSQSVNIPTSNLSYGVHMVGIRGKDANGVWGLDAKYLFYKPAPTTASTTAAVLKRIEYYIDNDPGYGNGTSISVSTDTAAVSFIAKSLACLASGTHKIGIRSQDANGAWSLDAEFAFTATQNPSFNNYPKPTVTIAASALNITPGSPVTFTAYTIYGGTSPNYAWYKNGVIAQSSSSNTYTTTDLANGDNVYCVATSSNNCLTLDTATSTPISINVSTKPIHLFNFSPHIATAGTKLMINGDGFLSSPITRVEIGGAAATSFTTINDNQLEAIVGKASNGIIKVSSSISSDILTDFIYSSGTNADYRTGIVQNYAGTGQAGFGGDGGPAIAATYNHPTSVKMDVGCKRLFISDTYNSLEREVYDPSTGTLRTTGGHKTPYLSKQGGTSGTNPPPGGNPPPSGTGGSTVTNSSPKGGSLLPNGFSLFVTATDDNRILGVDVSNSYYILAGSPTATPGFAGDNGPDSLALFNHPAGIVSDKHLPILYIADENNNRIRRIDLRTHIVTTYAGNGIAGFSGDGGLATAAALNHPHSLDIDSLGNLYIADTYNHRVRKVDTHGIINTIAGTGIAGSTDETSNALATTLNHPMDVSISPNGYLFIADTYNNRVRVLAQDGRVYTLLGRDNDTTSGYYGDGVPSTIGKLNMPTGVTWDTSGGSLSIYVADANNNMVRSVAFGNILPPNLWLGNVSSDWQDPANWSNNALPTATGTVTIPSGPPFSPKLTGTTVIDTLLLRDNLDLNGQSLTLNSAFGTARLKSTAQSSMTVNGNNNILIFDPTYNNLGNLTINGNTSLGSTLNLYGVLAVNAGTFNTSDALVLKSTSINNTAVVAPVLGTINGNVTVERNIPFGLRVFRDLAPGVNSASGHNMFTDWQDSGKYSSGYGVFITGSGKTSNGVTGFDPLTGFDYTYTGNPSVYQYTAGNWGALPNTIATTFTPFSAYRLLIRGNRGFNIFTTPQGGLNAAKDGPGPMQSPATLRSKGALATGTLTNNDLNPLDSGFTILANPYVAPVVWDSIYNNSTGISKSFWYLDPTFGNGDKYVVYNYAAGTNSIPVFSINGNTAPGSYVNKFIQPGQSIFVQSLVTGAPHSVTFKESFKAPAANKTGVFGTQSPNSLQIGLFRANTANVFRYIDAAVAVFDPTFGYGIGEEDSKKLNSASDNIAIANKGGLYSVDGRPIPRLGDTIIINLSQLATGDAYQIAINTADLSSPGLGAFLYDRYLKTTTAITGNTTTVGFTVDNAVPTSYNGRFAIYFGKTTLPDEDVAIKAVAGAKSISILWDVAVEQNTKNYTLETSTNGIDFTLLATVNAKNVSNAHYSYQLPLSFKGTFYYRIKASYNNFAAPRYSPVVSVVIGEKMASFTAYPNPLKGNGLNIVFTESQTGKYKAVLIDAIGQTVAQMEILHNGGTQKYSFATPQISKGLYRLNILSNDKLVFNTSISKE